MFSIFNRPSFHVEISHLTPMNEPDLKCKSSFYPTSTRHLPAFEFIKRGMLSELEESTSLDYRELNEAGENLLEFALKEDNFPELKIVQHVIRAFSKLENPPSSKGVIQGLVQSNFPFNEKYALLKTALMELKIDPNSIGNQQETTMQCLAQDTQYSDQEMRILYDLLISHAAHVALSSGGSINAQTAPLHLAIEANNEAFLKAHLPVRFIPSYQKRTSPHLKGRIRSIGIERFKEQEIWFNTPLGYQTIKPLAVEKKCSSNILEMIDQTARMLGLNEPKEGYKL